MRFRGIALLIQFALLALPVWSQTNIELVQPWVSASGTGTVSATLANAPTAGDTILVILMAQNGHTNSAPAGTGGGIAFKALTGLSFGSGGPRVDVYAAPSIGSGQGQTFSFTPSAGVGRIFVAEYSGFGYSVSIDVGSHANGTTTTGSTGTTATSTVANELWVNLFTAYSSSGSPTFSSPTAGYTLEQSQASSSIKFTDCVCDQVVGTTGTAGGDVTISGSGDEYGIALTLYPTPVPPGTQAGTAIGLTLTPYVSAGGQTPLWIDAQGGLWGIVSGQGPSAMGVLYYSPGDGQPWQQIYSFPNVNGQNVIIKNIWVSPISGSIFVGIWNNSNYEIMRSSAVQLMRRASMGPKFESKRKSSAPSGGTSWTDVLTFPANYGVTGRDNLAFDEFGNIFVVMTHCAAGIVGNDSVWRSTDDGNTFTSVLTQACPSQIETFRQIYIDPYNPSDVYALAGGADNTRAKIWASQDDGITWSAMLSGASANTASMGFYPSLLVWATDGPPLTRNWVFYSLALQKIVSTVPVENEVPWLNQTSVGLVAIGRQSLAGVPANVYTLAFELGAPNYQWVQSLTWKGGPSNSFRWGFASTNVGPGNEFYLLGDGLDDSTIDASECIRAVPFVGLTTDPWVAALPVLRPRFIPGN